jgi:alpha-galactosidase
LDPEIYRQDPVRFEMMLNLGYFCTESSGHASEYVSYFRKRPDLIERYTGKGYLGESGFYAHNWPRWRVEKDQRLLAYLTGEKEYGFTRSPEYASVIIEAMEANTQAVIYGNVLNTGLIDNLPQNGIVEVPCLVERRGILPVHVGPLPAHLACLDQQHMAFHDLVATAMIERNREAALYALMVDPLTSAVCSLAEIRMMFDEMVAAQQKYLPDFLSTSSPTITYPYRPMSGEIGIFAN